MDGYLADMRESYCQQGNTNPNLCTYVDGLQLNLTWVALMLEMECVPAFNGLRTQGAQPLVLPSHVQLMCVMTMLAWRSNLRPSTPHHLALCCSNLFGEGTEASGFNQRQHINQVRRGGGGALGCPCCRC